MKTALQLIGWTAATAVALTALFKPEVGLVHAGPGVAVGVGLLGAAMLAHARQQAAERA